MFKTSIRKRVSGLIVAALIAAPPMLAVPMTAFAQDDEGNIAITRVLYDDVIDTYLQYKCPNGYTSHNNSQYGVVYKSISYKNGYKYSGHSVVSSWKANVCGCGNGTVTKIKNSYYTW